MGQEIIKKPKLEEMAWKPNLRDYSRLYQEFRWEETGQQFCGQPGGGLNIAQEAIDRHCRTGRRNRVALYWEGKEGQAERYTFLDLKRLTNRFGNLLRSLGVQQGDRVFIFLERIPELYISVFGTLKVGAVVGPLFSAFGPEAVRDRLRDSGAKVLVTNPNLKERVEEIRADLPELRHMILVNRGNQRRPSLSVGDVLYEEAMALASPELEVASTGVEDYAIMHYTSGTTGKPKGAVHVHKAIQGHYATAKYVLDLQDRDIYWCTADPGWVTGTSYGMFGPWSNGVSSVVYEGGFDPEKWYRILEKYRVSVWYTAPTAIRMLMKAGEELPKRYDFSRLRYMCSVGEPLNPEAIFWGQRAFGLPFHDNWWQTETGCILIANYPVLDIRPGSMGKPFPGITAAILSDDWQELPPGEEGNLAIRPGWPSMFRTYWGNHELYQSRFKNGWYITGDRARRDEDGYFWFVGRADDVINTAGHLVGPFEVESALIEHPAVAEAGVIGKPDPERMEIVKAFVSLKVGYQGTDALREEIREFVRHRLAAHAYPREIEFTASLPKTRSGKIMRRLLRARELGLPEGDTSTLEEE
jgi:acetyl-CoA synthetase